MRFISLKGFVPYSEALRLQHQLVELRSRNLIPDTILFLEHEPVVTRGRGLQFNGEARPRQMPLSADRLPPEIAFCESGRGGDLTYHGPGQLVVYPICKLSDKTFKRPWPAQDVGGYIRGLEALVIEVLGEFGVRGEQKPQASGVWVGERKVASLGIAVRKWVTFHGVAINVVNSLAPFQLISPCGYQFEVMTRVEDLIPENQKVLLQNWRTEFEVCFSKIFCSKFL